MLCGVDDIQKIGFVWWKGSCCLLVSNVFSLSCYCWLQNGIPWWWQGSSQGIGSSTVFHFERLRCTLISFVTDREDEEEFSFCHTTVNIERHDIVASKCVGWSSKIRRKVNLCNLVGCHSVWFVRSFYKNSLPYHTDDIPRTFCTSFINVTRISMIVWPIRSGRWQHVDPPGKRIFCTDEQEGECRQTYQWYSYEYGTK